MYNMLFSVSAISDAIVSGLSGTLGEGYPILYNSIGAVAIILQIMIFQMKSKRNIVFVGLFSNIGWLSYFALQGDLISCTSGIIGIVSKIIILLGAKQRWAGSKWWSVGFLAFAATFSIFTFKGWLDIFAFVASMLSVSAYFIKKENTMRKVFLFAYCAYICNSISKMYAISLIADITALISVVVSLIRYGRQEKKAEPEEDLSNQSAE